MYRIAYTGTFKKDYKRLSKRHYNLDLFQIVVSILENNGTLPSEYQPHKLSGNYSDCWECHLSPDWLLIWMQDDDQQELIFIRTGTHSDLF